MMSLRPTLDVSLVILVSRPLFLTIRPLPPRNELQIPQDTLQGSWKGYETFGVRSMDDVG